MGRRQSDVISKEKYATVLTMSLQNGMRSDVHLALYAWRYACFYATMLLRSVAAAADLMALSYKNPHVDHEYIKATR